MRILILALLCAQLVQPTVADRRKERTPRPSALQVTESVVQPGGEAVAQAKLDSQAKGSRNKTDVETDDAQDEVVAMNDVLHLSSGGLDATQSQGGKRELGGYGLRSLHALSQWWMKANPWGDGPVPMKVMFWAVLSVQFIGPILMYSLIRVLVFARADTTFKNELVDATRPPLKVACFFLCTVFALFTLMGGTTKPYPLLMTLVQVLEALVAWAIALVPIRVLQHFDRLLEQLAMDRVTSTDFLERRDFMNAIKYGSNIVGPTDSKDDHGYFLFKYIWRPFYLATVFIIGLFALISATGSKFEGVPFALGIGYLATSMLLATFGARTMGPQIYGSILLFMEKPFKEGDIITLDAKQGGGAATDVQKSVVTGFVERIGICTTTIRRFDMRCVWVPNNMFAENPVANWNTRPRKLILVEFNISHRTPPDVCKLFQENVLFVVKNHEKIDQTMYMKCAINKIKHGLGLQIVCFNLSGTKKKEVQQDLLLRIVSLARRMQVDITFEQQNLYVEREEIPPGTLYKAEPNKDTFNAETLNLKEILPKKKSKPTEKERWFAPKNKLIVRIDTVHLNVGATSRSSMGGRLDDEDSADDQEDGMTGRMSSCEKIQKKRRRPYKLVVHATEPKAMSCSTRVAHFQDDDQDSVVQSLRFFENVSFPLASERLPDQFRVDLIQIGRGLASWALQNEIRIATANVDVRSVVLETESISLPLEDNTGNSIGSVEVSIFVPEGVANKCGWECKKTVTQRPSVSFAGALALEKAKSVMKEDVPQSGAVKH